MSSLKTNLYHFVKPYYRRIINKLVSDFQINERNHALAVANVNIKNLHNKIGFLQSQQNNLLSLVQATNALSGGLYTGITEVIPNQMLAETYEIIQLLSGMVEPATSAVTWLSQIPSSEIKNSSIILVGVSNPLYQTELFKKGAKKITTISFTPVLHSPSKSGSKYTLHPADLDKLTLPIHDILLASDPSVASLLIKHQLFNLGSFITSGAYFSLNVTSSSLKSRQQYFKSELRGSTLIYTDALARKLIHDSGFVEVITQNGSAIKKSHFNYIKGLTITKNTYPAHKSGVKSILYRATKLPIL